MLVRKTAVSHKLKRGQNGYTMRTWSLHSPEACSPGKPRKIVGTGFMCTQLNGYLVLQGSIHFRTAYFQYFLGTRWSKYPLTRCRYIYIYIYTHIYIYIYTYTHTRIIICHVFSIICSLPSTLVSESMATYLSAWSISQASAA